MASRYDIAIVGGGIVGLATAYRLLQEAPDARLVLLEKERELAMHQTGRNSGVVHAGIYYPPGSLKARLATSGRRQLRRFAVERGLPYEQVGKVVVATEPKELARLRELRDRATANGVEGLRELDRDGLREIEPHVRGIAALHSPVTAITDFRRIALTLAREITDRGAEILLGHEVVDLHVGRGGLGELDTASDRVTATTVVTCAGLQSDRLATSTGGTGDLRIVPFRGSYLRLRGAAKDLVRGNVYPVPDRRYPFLGVHFTPTVDGEVLVGPNATLALHREGYGKEDRLRWEDARDTFTFGGFWRLVADHTAAGLWELWRDRVRSAFIRSARRYVPELDPNDVEEAGCGIRAQAVTADGSLVDDFVIESRGPFVHVRNAPSPAATACLAIGEVIASRLPSASKRT